MKYLAKYGTMSVIIVPTGTSVRLSKSMHTLRLLSPLSKTTISEIRMKGVQILEWESSDAFVETLQGIDTVLLTCTVGNACKPLTLSLFFIYNLLRNFNGV